MAEEASDTKSQVVGQNFKHHYKKNKGFSGFRGEAFEFKTCALLFARASKLKLKFKMASSAVGYGAFDDIVLNLNDGRSKFCLFMQLKNKSKGKIRLENLLSKTHDFGLSKYYDSYMGIKNRFVTERRDIPFDVEFDDCVFILYTNADMEETLKHVLDPKEFPLEFANAGGSVMKLDEEKHKEVCDAFRELPDFHNFLSKFFIMYNQPNEDNFDSLISSEILESLNLAGPNGKTALDTFCKELTNWWGRLHKSVYLTDEWTLNNPLYMTKNHLVHLKISNLLEERKLEIEELQLKFINDALLEEVVNQRRVTLILAEHVENSLCKVYQTFRRNDKYGIFKFENLQEQKSEILLAWEGDSFDVLIVYNVPSSEELHLLCSQMSQICECSENKKVVLVIDIENKKGIKTIKSSLGEQLTVCYDDVDFSKFQPVTKNKLLEKKCMFQGYQIPMSVLGENPLGCLDGETLTLLLQGNLKIGKSLPEPVDYYVPRSLESHRIVSSDILKEAGVVFCLYGGLQSGFSVLLPNLQNIYNFSDRMHNPSYRYLWVDHIQDFQTVCEEKTQVIWLQKDGELLLLKRSYGAMHVVNKHLHEDIATQWQPKTLIEGDDEIVTLTAEPGMGKSTLLTHLFVETKEQHPHLWIVRININDFTDMLCKFKENTVQEVHAIELLEKAAGLKNVFQKQLFKDCYEMGNMVVLVDGIDEISPHYSEVVFQILKILFDRGIRKIWITARSFLKSKLDEFSGVKSYKIIPFNENDQKRLFKKFWETRIEKLDEATTNSCIDYILKLVVRCLNYNNDDFMGIPLQCVLLAEVFEDVLKCTDPKSKLETYEDFNILQLYDKFIDRKWTICNEEKKKAVLSNVHVIKDNVKLKDIFLENNKLAALLSLFSKRDLKLVNDDDTGTKGLQYLNEIKEADDKTGLIIAVNGETAQFLHRTVAEYFVAKWLFDHREGRIGKFVKEIIFKPEYLFTRRMLDYQLADGFPLHMSILNGNLDKNINLLETAGLVNEQDRGGRTPLHLAVMHQLPVETKILLEHGADENIKDFLLSQSSVHYAIYSYHLVIQFEEIFKFTNLSSCEVITEIMNARPETRNYISSEIAPPNVKYVNVDETYSLLKAMAQFYINKGGDLNKDVMKYIAFAHRDDIIYPNVGNPEVLKSQAALGVNEKNTNIRTSRFGFLEHIAYFEEGQNFKTANLPKIPLVININATNNQHEIIELQRNGFEGNILLNNNGEMSYQFVDYCSSEYGKIIFAQTPPTNLKSLLDPAVDKGNITLARLLLESGATVNASTNEDPLCVAAKTGRLELCKVLLEYISANDLCFPLTVAVQSGQLEIAKLFISKCIRSSDMELAPFAAKGTQGSQDTTFLFENVVREYHQLFNVCVAAECGFLEMVRLLIELGADVNKLDGCYGTPLIAAAQGGQIEIAKFLLSEGACADIKNKIGKTALHAAACSFSTDDCISSNAICKYVQVCELLIEKGADVNVVNSSDCNCTPLHCAIAYNHLHVVQCLVNHGARFSIEGQMEPPLYASIDYGNFESTKLMLRRCNSVDSPFEYKYSPLCAAIFPQSFDYKIVNLILDSGANVNFVCKEKCTPLFSASVMNKIEMARLLLSRGADVNVAHATGWTPLHVSFWLPSTDVAELLLEHGASINTKDKYGRTPLHFATLNFKLKKIPHLLKNHENSLKIADENGWTPLFFAAKFGLTFRLFGTDCGIHDLDKEGRPPLFVSALNGHAIDNAPVIQ